MRQGGRYYGYSATYSIENLHRTPVSDSGLPEGYAWTKKHLKDFWSDIQQLEPDHNHYTGVLTLEDVFKWGSGQDKHLITKDM